VAVSVRESERTALRGALAAISGACPFCSDSAVELLWNPVRGRHVLRVLHAPGCLALRRPSLAQDVSDYLVLVLQLWGAPVGQYLEDDFIASHSSWGG
jgi:hypothetical protein